MKVYRLPEDPRALIFDMDLTLYTSEEYGRAQVDSLIERLAAFRGEDFEKMKGEIAARRRDWACAHGGASLSMSQVFSLFYGVPMEENIRWREEAYHPELYLREDPRLQKTLGGLSSLLDMALVTNNAEGVARKTLAILGVADFFPVVVGLGACPMAKPHPLPFLRAAELLGREPGQCVSVGDRYDVDLAPPLELGMGGILVDGVEDVYTLGELFLPGDPAGALRGVITPR